MKLIQMLWMFKLSIICQIIQSSKTIMYYSFIMANNDQTIYKTRSKKLVILI
jgi:hypothetical protein